MTEMHTWKKSSRSGVGSNNCVELARLGNETAVRDSKQPAAGFLSFTPAAFDMFLSAVKSGRLDQN